LIVGITRVRNEELIIEDTLKHFLCHVDRVYLYDDASIDNTVRIASSFDNVYVTRGDVWRRDRPAEETRHRALLLDQAPHDAWVLCFDADERLDGSLPDDRDVDGYRFPLYDGYMTPYHSEPYTGGALADLPRMWGPECRHILMFFRRDKARYVGLDQREPAMSGVTERRGPRVKHFGKCLSVEHWEETCDYYSTHWGEPYRTKWHNRKGKAIHTMSDFGRPLCAWEDLPL